MPGGWPRATAARASDELAVSRHPSYAGGDSARRARSRRNGIREFIRADPFRPERTMRHTTSWLLSVVLAAAVALASSPVAAQPAAGTMKQDAATSGNTVVATEGFDAAKK